MGGLALVERKPRAGLRLRRAGARFFVGLALIALLVMKIGAAGDHRLPVRDRRADRGALSAALRASKLVGGYVIAVVAVVALPALWAVLFALAAALMVDAHNAGGGGFNAFIAQFWVLGRLAGDLRARAQARLLGLRLRQLDDHELHRRRAAGRRGERGRGQLPERHPDCPQGPQPLQRGQLAGRRESAAGEGARRSGRPHRRRAAHPRARRGASRSGRLERRGEDRRDRRSGGRDRRRERRGAQAAGAAAKGAARAPEPLRRVRRAPPRRRDRRLWPSARGREGDVAAAEHPVDGTPASRCARRAARAEARHPAAPAAQPAPPSESARRTPRPAQPPTKRPPAPPSNPQSPPRGPRRSDGGKGE